MKSTILLLAVAGAGAAFALAQAPASQPAPAAPAAPAASAAPAEHPAAGAARGEAKVTVAGKTVSIDYGRPALQGRDPLKLAEVGKPWRMGKDGATTLNTQAELTFGTVTVPAGTYILTATRVAEDKWSLNFNDKDRKKVAEAPLTEAPVSPAAELFTIDLKEAAGGGTFRMSWGPTSLSTNFTAK